MSKMKTQFQQQVQKAATAKPADGKSMVRALEASEIASVSGGLLPGADWFASWRKVLHK